VIEVRLNTVADGPDSTRPAGRSLIEDHRNITPTVLSKLETSRRPWRKTKATLPNMLNLVNIRLPSRGRSGSLNQCACTKRRISQRMCRSWPGSAGGAVNSKVPRLTSTLAAGGAGSLALVASAGYRKNKAEIRSVAPPARTPQPEPSRYLRRNTAR